eukprot:3214_1
MAAKDAEVPAAEEEKEEEKRVEIEEDSKAEPLFKMKRVPKEDPGDGLPPREPEFIEFKWNKEFKQKKQCDTLHTLYLLHLALGLVRVRTIERNKYFKSIGRSDRYINQLDGPQIVTNFLDWHNADKDKNKFDGHLLETGEKLHMINEVISKIGNVKKGPATKIYTKWKKEVPIENVWMDLPQPKLQLQNWGYTKMYKAEKIIDECDTEEIIKLLTFVNKEPEKKSDDDDVYVQGVFAAITKKKKTALMNLDDWQNKVETFFADNNITGKTLKEKPGKQIVQECMDALIPPTELNEKGKPKNTILRGGVNGVLRALKGCAVNDILTAYDAQNK